MVPVFSDGCGSEEAAAGLSLCFALLSLLTLGSITGSSGLGQPGSLTQLSAASAHARDEEKCYFRKLSNRGTRGMDSTR